MIIRPIRLANPECLAANPISIAPKRYQGVIVVKPLNAMLDVVTLHAQNKKHPIIAVMPGSMGWVIQYNIMKQVIANVFWVTGVSSSGRHQMNNPTIGPRIVLMSVPEGSMPWSFWRTGVDGEINVSAVTCIILPPFSAPERLVPNAKAAESFLSILTSLSLQISYRLGRKVKIIVQHLLCQNLEKRDLISDQATNYLIFI